jgi:hypothetical protein
VINGGSTGFAPIHVRTVRVATIAAMNHFVAGENFLLIFCDFFTMGSMKITREEIRATTPPNFDGMDRRMAYANRKYHSGWMWVGVSRGFASLKFSGSAVNIGSFLRIAVTIIIKTMTGVKSLDENPG